MNPRFTLTPERHLFARSVINTACLAVALCAGRRPEEVAAEVAARAIRSLREKGGTRP
jgi:hypothetical protein